MPPVGEKFSGNLQLSGETQHMRLSELLKLAAWFGLAIGITFVAAEALKASHSRPDAVAALGEAPAANTARADQ
jgi:hypothetical protein